MFTDHDPLVYASHSATYQYSPREISPTDLVPQFAVDIHVSGTDDSIGATLPLTHQLLLPLKPRVGFDTVAQVRVTDPDIGQLKHNSPLNQAPVHITAP